MAKMECKFLQIDDCDAVISDPDLFTALTGYVRHLEERHPAFFLAWINEKPVSELFKQIDHWIER